MYYWVCRLEPWYRGLHRIQQVLVIVGAVVVVFAMGLWLTHTPSERPRQKVIILNCDKCGTDPERSISYNEYMDRKDKNNAHGLQIENKNCANKFGTITAALVGAVDIHKIETVKNDPTFER